MNAKSTTLLILTGVLFVSIRLAVAEGGITTKFDVREGPQPIATSDSNVGRLIPDLEFTPVSGKKFRLSTYNAAPAVVIAFTSTSCAVTKRYAPTLATIEKQYSARGVKFIFVNPIAADASTDITAAIRTHGFTGPYVRDTRGEIAASLDAHSTAEVFVLDAARTLVYRGAVDDQYGLGYSQDAPKSRYLAAALDALLAGRQPPVAATTAPGCALEKSSGKTITAVPLTYHARISRIIQQHCVECHREGGVGPFSLESYADVTGHAGMIRKVVEKDVMPPWFAAPVHGSVNPWSNDRTLPAQDKADLIAWLAGGKKEGERADAPLQRSFPKDWEIGKPDAVIQIPEPIAVKTTGKMPYQNVFVETKFTEDTWVSAIEVRPTAREVVHHVLVFVVTADKLEAAKKRRRDDQGGNFFAVYVPGNNVLTFPDGFAKLIPAGASLHFQIHYTPKGTATQDQTRIGFVFAKSPPKHEVRVAAISAKLQIPPGDDNYEAHGTIPVPFDAKILSFMPHMHVRGKAYRYEIELPNRTKQTLLEVPHYDFNWQLQYRLANPVDAPTGSRLLGTAWYDNSAKNPANPDPTREVRWGEQTDDEMMLGYFEYYVPSMLPDGKQASLTEMVMRDGGFIFIGLDKNHDDRITIDESPDKSAFREADANGDGEVTREEFKVYWQRRNARTATKR